MSKVQEVDAVVVGAGFAGMYMQYRLLDEGLSVQGFETGANVGGTWYWNRYPGARCGVESMDYSYQFSDDLQQEWEWSERYAPQPEILTYASHVADKFKLRDNIKFNTRVKQALFDETLNKWRVTTDQGDEVIATYCIMATGCLSSTNLPKFDGLDSFEGDWYHTGLWPHAGVDFTGKRVAVVGTGSSAIQSIPVIAEQAGHLTVFQRTANFSIPAHNGPLAPEYIAQVKGNYAQIRAENNDTAVGFGARWASNDDSVFDADEDERKRMFEETWARGGFQFMSAFGDLGLNTDANEIAANFVREKIRGIVKDAKTAELLSPKQVLGCKRLCVDTGYFETFNRDNVELVNVKDHPIERITPKGLVTNGEEHSFDIIVFATGFDAMTGSLLSIDTRGRDGLKLKDKWEAGPRTFLGLQTHGFPNLFTISGPGSPSVLTNMIVSIEQHVNWIARCILYMRINSKQVIEADLDAENEWVEHTNDLGNGTLYPSCNSWYLGANIPGKPRVFMPYVGGFQVYSQKCEEIANTGYRGFDMR